jgi:tRNA 2-selenouridine synthase
MADLNIPTIPLEQTLEKDYAVIDVRSPKEFSEFHLPDSYNFPLFTNEERAEVGTAYKQVSPEEAKKIGMKYFSEKLPDFYEMFHQIQKHKKEPVIIACARGGMRSGTFAALMNSLDFPAVQLEGGIRSFRYYVLEELERFSLKNWNVIVIGGNTGTRKTVWLEKLHELGYPVLNLEQIASHRGSIFGHIGMEKRSQKMFEQKLVKELQRLEQEPYILMEAESKRIGPVILPEWLQEVKEKGRFLELEDNMERRVHYLLEEYEPEVHTEAFFEALHRLMRRLKPKTYQVIEKAAERGDFYTIFRKLLEEYYDPSYRHKQPGYIEKENLRKLYLADLPNEAILPYLIKEINVECKRV